ncbi:protein Dok-7 isoform X3 [Brienomyrus brachyistius]|uniref:protein Dok-7 isoform X3 n=1 Tax=Brienomyrus brachyistius TaxID=42636 RepID=UPI0020B409B7|nr:protein Dok-7 isoform X3 [Brienomyrus brachyistius]
MTDTVVVEGQAKYRDGKKWKSRWVALRKPSPVADCLVLLVYKDRSDKTKGHKERSSVTLEDICGLEPGPPYEGVSYTLAIVTLSQAVMLGFDSKEALLAWDIRIRYSLGEVHRFSVGVLPGTRLESGPATLHLCNNLLVLARDLPPAVVGQWKLSDLRRYGAVPNGFVFEGGTRCGYWAGVFFLSCLEGEQISFLFDCIVRGVSPTRGPFGLRPVLPDPNASPASMEERARQETQELEKRLSLLSHCSRQSSAASTCSYGASVASDEHSISSSSSETSHSDTSLGSRLTLWAEPGTRASGAVEPLGQAQGRGPLHTEESLGAGITTATRVLSKPTRSRGLQEIGRQSSSDSGIATGSHSSYSGSFSSYTGSLDIGQGDEFGSLLSLPDRNVCTCPAAEYQVPGSLRPLYDTPRSLRQSAPPRDQLVPPAPDAGGGPDLSTSRRPAAQSGPELGELAQVSTDSALKLPATQKHGATLDLRAAEVAPPAASPLESHETFSLQSGMARPLFASCPVCGKTKGTTLPHPGVLSVPAGSDKKSTKKEDKGKGGVAYEAMERRGVEKPSEVDERSSYELMGSCGQQRLYADSEGAVSSMGSSAMVKAHRQASDPKGGYELMASTVDAPRRGGVNPAECGSTLAFLGDVAVARLPERPRGSGPTYVNIPISPASKKQLHYMELELQEPGSAVRGNGAHLRGRRGGSTKYALIDIAATETAHKVGSQHAQCREERLQQLEQRKKGAPQ